MNQATSLSDSSGIDSGYGSYENDGFHLDLERYWIEARSLRYWLGGILVVTVLAGLIATLLSTELYRANTRIEVSQTTANVTAIDPLENESRVSEIQYLNTQYELLESRFMAARVAKAGNLLRDEAFMEAFALNEATEEVAVRDVEKLLLENIAVAPITQSSLVDVSFSSPSPEISAKVTNLWAEEFIAANYEKRFGANIDARDFLKIVRAVGNMTPDQARRYAIGLGSPELAKVALLSSGTRERLLRSTETGMGMPEMRASAEIDANLEIIGSSISRLTRMIAGPWVRASALVLDRLSYSMENFGGITLAFLSPISALLKMFMDFYDAISGGSKNSPIDKNTQAIEDLTKTMKDGVYGGDRRAQGARPSGMRGPAFEEARRNRQLRPSPI
jgi:capsular polysaccharide biosynthesis protein